MTIMKTKTDRKLSKTFNILAIASIAAILLGSITFFSEQAYSSDAGGNLVVHYDFEDGVSPTSDVSGHGNNGTLVGGATFSTDVPPVGGGLKSLDLTAGGTGDYLIKNPVAIAPTPFPSTDMTVAFWVKSSDSGIPAFLSYAEAAQFNAVVIQNLFTGVEGCINNSCTPAATPGILDGTWHHIAVTWQSSDGETKVYADGVPSTHTEATGTSIAGAGSLVLGQEQDSVGGGFSGAEAFEGLLDDVRIYDRVLTELEVLLLSTEGCSSGFYKNDAKKFGATQWTTYVPTTEFEFSAGGGIFDDIATLKGKGNSDDTEPNLLEALNTRGSEHNALAREAVSALLNSQVGSGVDYALTEAEVIILVNDALGGSAQDIEDARASLFALNHAGCPLLHGPKV